MRGPRAGDRHQGQRADRGAGSPPRKLHDQKKSVTAAERERLDVQAKREEFKAFLAEADPISLIFIDESGCHIGMTRTRARAPRGKRAVAVVPRNRGRVLTMIGAMSLDGFEALMQVVGGTSAAVFETFVREHLGPRLRPGDIVVLDNLKAHHANGIRELIESFGARVVYLPPYSPDLNPIELAWSKIKDQGHLARRRGSVAGLAQDRRPPCRALHHALGCSRLLQALRGLSGPTRMIAAVSPPGFFDVGGERLCLLA